MSTHTMPLCKTNPFFFVRVYDVRLLGLGEMLVTCQARISRANTKFGGFVKDHGIRVNTLQVLERAGLIPLVP